MVNLKSKMEHFNTHTKIQHFYKTFYISVNILKPLHELHNSCISSSSGKRKPSSVIRQSQTIRNGPCESWRQKNTLNQQIFIVPFFVSGGVISVSSELTELLLISLPFPHTYSSRHLNRAGLRGPCWHQKTTFVGPPKKGKECVSDSAESLPAFFGSRPAAMSTRARLGHWAQQEGRAQSRLCWATVSLQRWMRQDGER